MLESPFGLGTKLFGSRAINTSGNVSIIPVIHSLPYGRKDLLDRVLRREEQHCLVLIWRREFSLAQAMV